MRYQSLIMMVFSIITLINALQIEPEAPHNALEARAKRAKKGRVTPKPKPLPKKTNPPPKAKQQPKKEPNEVKCDPISKYTSSWFIANMCEKPKPGKCLFYTRHLSATAAKYGRSHGYSTIWDMWDKSLYDNSRAKRNPLRCIMAANKAGDAMRKYFANMSRAMAFQCDGFATVMDKQVSATNKKFNALRKDGIWYTVEFPQLQLGGFGKKVEQIMAMSPDGSNEFTYWSRAGGNAAKRDVLGAAGNQTEADLGVVNPDDIVLPAEVEQAIDDMVDEMRADHGDAAEKRELTKRTKSPLARCVNGKGSPGAAKDAEGIAW